MSKKMPWIGTSWKMNMTRGEAQAFAKALAKSPVAQSSEYQSFVVPPFPYIAEAAGLLQGTRVRVGAQKMQWADNGAWTGEVSPLMLKDCCATLVEIGHSERRTHFGETDERVALKTQTALRHGLTALVCIGDTREEFDSGKTSEALERQARGLLKYVSDKATRRVIIAYEPVWSIGEGGTPASPEFANEQHMKIVELVTSLTGSALPILYGGGVNLQNCADLARQSHIDGLLIGRAAWDVDGFLRIISKVMETSS